MSWNAHGLFCVSGFPKMMRTIKLIKKQLRQQVIFCVQETHGNWPLLNKHFRDILKDFWVFASFGAPNSGGVIVFVPKVLCPNRIQISDIEHFPGRSL